MIISVFSVQTGFVASPSYLRQTVYFEYFAAAVYLLTFLFVFWNQKVWRWHFIATPILALLFARMTISVSLPYVLNFFMHQTSIVYKYTVVSKERTKRCQKAIQLTTKIENRFFDHFNFCQISYLDHERVVRGQSIEIKGNGSKWGFYPFQYRVVE